jgi:hypothetical protein
MVVAVPLRMQRIDGQVVEVGEETVKIHFGEVERDAEALEAWCEMPQEVPSKVSIVDTY